MKYLLAAMCGIVVLFMGGCAIISVAAMPFPLIPAALAALNVAVLGALFGWKFQWWPAFYILGAIDLLIAVVALFTAGSMGPQDQPVFWIAAAVFALKGVLSIAYARRKAEGV